MAVLGPGLVTTNMNRQKKYFPTQFTSFLLRHIGQLDYHGGTFLMPTGMFAATKQLYEMRLELRKGERMASTRIQIFIGVGRPPIMEIQ